MGRNFNQKPLGITEKLETDALKTALGSWKNSWKKNWSLWKYDCKEDYKGYLKYYS